MKRLKITLLGTVGSVASKKRGYPAIVVNDNLLLDCGEGTTQKLIQLELIDTINTICLSHLHCDHYTGIFTLLWHYWIAKRTVDINIIGPKGIKETIEKIIKLVNTPISMRSCKLNYIELEENNEIQSIQNQHDIKGMKTNHVPLTFAFRISDGNKSMCYTSDTGPCKELVNLIKGSNVLITETTFPDKFSELAHSLRHSTPSDAAELAELSHCDTLVLFHISSYYEELLNNFKEEAERKFKKEVILAQDLLILEI